MNLDWRSHPHPNLPPSRGKGLSPMQLCQTTDPDLNEKGLLSILPVSDGGLVVVGSGQRHGVEFGYQGLGGEHHARDAGGVFEGGPGYLCRVNYAKLEHIAVALSFGVEAEVVFARGYLVQDHLAGQPCVVGYDSDRLFGGAQDYVHAGSHVPGWPPAWRRPSERH